MFMDIDFKDRTVLHLISYEEYIPLMQDDKIAALLDELWVGELTYSCDGRINNYSRLNFVASAPLKKLPKTHVSFKEIVHPKWEPKMDDSFTFQYKFRKSSIGLIF